MNRKSLPPEPPEHFDEIMEGMASMTFAEDKKSELEEGDRRRINAAYKRYPDLELEEFNPYELAHFFEQAVLLNTEYTQKSFVHKMLLQASHTIRELAAQSKTKAPQTATVEELADFIERALDFANLKGTLPVYLATAMSLRNKYPFGLIITDEKQEV